MASLDPFSGQETYSAQSVGAGMAIDGMQGVGVDAPLAFRMLENLPGLATSVGFSTARGTGTILRGGFMDNSKRFTGMRSRNYRVIQDGVLNGKHRNQFFGGRRGIGELLGGEPGFLGRRAEKLAAGTKHSGFFRSARANNFTARPRALTRYHSLSVFGEGTYTPFGASKMIGNNRFVKSFFEKEGLSAGSGGFFGPGTMSFISAGTRADRLERKALRGSGRALNSLGRVDNSIKTLAQMNNSELLASRISFTGTGVTKNQALNMSLRERGGLGAMEYAEANKFRTIGSASIYDATLAGGGVGIRGNLLASSMAGPGSRYAAGYFRGAQGFSSAGGLMGEAEKGALKAVGHFETAAAKIGLEGPGMGRLLEGSVLKNMGGRDVLRTLATKEGATVLGARAAAMAIPGLNVVATASMLYDLGKMAGEVVKSGINLSRDAAKSMKGSINKPLFGMGYKDTEAAATSRARGVLAIQNSQLNARSALGNEAALMAAHFG